MDGGRTRREQATLVCIALVFVLLPLLRGGRDAAALPIALGVLSLALVFLFVEGRLTGTGIPIRWYRRPTVWLLLFAAIAAAGLFFSVNRFATATGVAELLCLAGYFMLGSRLRKELGVLSWMLVGSAVIVSLIGLLRFVQDSQYRIGSVFENANALGGFLLLPLFLAFALARASRTAALRSVANITGGLLLITLLLAFSVTGMVAMLFGLLVWWIVAGRPLPSRRALRTGALVLLLATAVIIGLRWIRLGSLSSAVSLKETMTVIAGQTSLRQRGHFLSATLRMFRERPLAGSGYNTWSVLHPLYQQTPLEKPLYAHSWYAQTAAETGAIGTIALLGFLVTTIIVIRSNRNAAHTPLAAGLVAGLAAAALQGGIDFAWNFLAVSIPVAFFAGMATARPDEEDASLRVGMASLWERIGTVAGILLIFVSTIVALGWFYGRSLQTSAGERLQTGDTETAKTWLKESLVFAPDPNVRRDYAALLFQTATTQEEKQTAKAVAERASREDPYDARAHDILGTMADDGGDPTAAEREFRTALEYDPMNNPSYALDLALLLARQNRWDELSPVLITYLDRYRTDRPYAFNPSLPQQLAEMNQYLGEAALHRNDTAAAKQYFQTALTEDSTFPLTEAEKALLGN